MKKSSFLLFTIYCLLFTVFWGCGNGPGTPGSSGSEDTGIEISSVSMIPNPTDGGDRGQDIDVNVGGICGNTGEPEKETGLFRVDATMSITASKLNSTGTFDPFPASVEQCTITYRTDVLGAPTIKAWTIFPNCPINNGSNTCIVNLIDIQRKIDFWNDIITGKNSPEQRPTRYVASYNCKVVNHVGESMTFPIEQEIFLDDFLSGC